MMNKILLIALFAITTCALFFCTGCNRKMAMTKSQVIANSDSVTHDTTTIIKDSLIVVPGKMVVVHDSVPCKEAVLYRQEKSGHVTATINLQNGKLEVKCEADSLQLLVQMLKAQLIRTANFSRRSEVSSESKTIEVRKMPLFYKWLLIASLIVNALLLFLFSVKK